MIKKYRILMADRVNGQDFFYAIVYKAKGLIGADRAATTEFPEASIVEIRRVN